MATPPRSAADRDFRPPSRRPIGVRAPATMTVPDMVPPARGSVIPVTIPSAGRRPRGPDPAASLRKTSHATGPLAPCGPTARRTTMGAWPSTSPLTCSPTSTTSASPCPTSTRRSRSTATPSAWRPCTGRPTRSRASAEAMVAVGDSGSCIQLLAPLNESSTIAKFLDRSGPGLQQLAYRVTDLEAVSRDPAGARRPPAVRRAPAWDERLARQLRPPQGRRRRPRGAGRARRSRPLSALVRRQSHHAHIPSGRH